MVRDAAAKGLRLRALGAGTRGGLGRPPSAATVPIETAGLARLLRYDPDDLTVSAEAGMAFGELQERLRERGQWLPVNPPGAADSTLGGLLATGASGALRGRYGSWRDLVLGMTVVLSSGERVKSGGQVVKNVAGYDLHKLHLGALGTLGLIGSVNLRVQPLPRERRLVLLGCESRAEAARIAVDLAASQLEPAAVEVVARGDENRPIASPGQAARTSPLHEMTRHPVFLAVRLAGGLADCEHGAAVVLKAGRDDASACYGGDECLTAWRELDQLPASGATVCRISTSPARAARLAASGPDGGATVLIADFMSGVVHIAWGAGADAVKIASVVDSLRGELGREGNVVLTAAEPAVRERVDVWGPRPPGYALMAAVKRALDPAGLWNPGCFVGEL